MFRIVSFTCLTMKLSLNKIAHEKIFTEFPISNFGYNNYLPLIYSRYNSDYADYNINDYFRLLTESFSRKLSIFIAKEITVDKIEGSLDDYIDVTNCSETIFPYDPKYKWKYPFSFELNFSNIGKSPNGYFDGVAYYEITNRSEHYWIVDPNPNPNQQTILISDNFSTYGNDEFFPDFNFLSVKVDTKNTFDVLHTDNNLKEIIDEYDGKGYDAIIINQFKATSIYIGQYFYKGMFVIPWSDSYYDPIMFIISNKELVGNTKYIKYGSEIFYKDYRQVHYWYVDPFVENFKKLICVTAIKYPYFHFTIENNLRSGWKKSEICPVNKGYYFLSLKGFDYSNWYSPDPYFKKLYLTVQKPVFDNKYFVPDYLLNKDVKIKLHLLYNGILKEGSHIFI